MNATNATINAASPVDTREKEYSEYRYECSCGELYRLVEYAVTCRKCRNYSERGFCTEVYDVVDNIWVYESPILAREREQKIREAEYQLRAEAPFTLGDACPELAQITF